MKPLVTCILTGWKEDPPENIIKNMLAQTYKNKQLLVFCSDMDLQPLKKKYPKVEFFDVPNRKDWAQVKRAMGIAFAEGKYICFCNADDEFDPNFLEIMVGVLEKENNDLAYCNWLDRDIDYKVANAELKIRGITCGSILFRADIAKRVGLQHRQYAADWYFVRDLLKEGIQVCYVPMALMIHH